LQPASPLTCHPAPAAVPADGILIAAGILPAVAPGAPPGGHKSRKTGRVWKMAARANPIWASGFRPRRSRFSRLCEFMPS